MALSSPVSGQEAAEPCEEYLACALRIEPAGFFSGSSIVRGVDGERVAGYGRSSELAALFQVSDSASAWYARFEPSDRTASWLGGAGAALLLASVFGMINGPSIEVFGGMRVVGIHRAMSFAEPAMRELWQEFRLRVETVRDRLSDDFISMRIYEEPVGAAPTPGSRFEQWAAVEVDASAEVPDGMDSHTLVDGRYAVFTYRGRADAFGGAARYIYGDWLPRSEYELADREFFEVLGPSYRPDDPEARETIWIPICKFGNP